MTNPEIIRLLDITHPPGFGRKGFKIELTHPYGLIFDEDDNMILQNLMFRFIDSVGPFKNWIESYFTVITCHNEYGISYRSEFWGKVSERDALDHYLSPLLNELRLYINNPIRKGKQTMLNGEVIYNKRDADNTEYYSFWIEQIKTNNHTYMGGKDNEC